jgi:hypothetical protein
MSKSKLKLAKKTVGEQLDLIDVEPKNKKELLRVARRYKTVQYARIEALKIEIALKEKLLAAVKAAKIVPDADGSYRFRVGNCTIKVKPRDELVKVKFDDEDEE